MHAEHADNSELDELSGRVIGCAFTVLNTLGAGFLEKVYENALAIELRAAGLGVVQQSKHSTTRTSAGRAGDQTRRARSVNRTGPSACLACIGSYLRLDLSCRRAL